MNKKSGIQKDVEKVYSIRRKGTSSVLDNMFAQAGLPVAPKIEQSWAEVDAIYEQIAVGLVETATNVNDAIHQINDIGIHSDMELATVVRGLTSDIEQFSITLRQIKDRHQGREGQVGDGDDLALCIDVFQDYVALNERFRSIVFPAVLTITEKLGDAVQAAEIIAKEKAANEQQLPAGETGGEVAAPAVEVGDTTPVSETAADVPAAPDGIAEEVTE